VPLARAPRRISVYCREKAEANRLSKNAHKEFLTMAANDEFGALTLGKWLLVAGCDEGETLEQVMSGLFAELRVPLFRYVVAMLSSAEEAEDVTQECFLRLFLELRSGKRLDSPKAWLFRVGHNLALDRWRSASPEQGLDGPARNVADERHPSSEEAVLQQERLAWMRAAINRLSTQQRLCLHLRTESFRYREIADILGVSESTVCENIRRGLSRLMKDCHEL
jgi:RNA polymerase sigma-70 factor (ECF subfamily)